MADLISVAEAQRLILERAKPLEAERVPIERATGRVLAQSAAAVVDLPPFPSSAMDGYAVRSADLAHDSARVLEIVEEIDAGVAPRRGVAAGQCALIMTGAPIPDGADTVVMLEHAERLAAGSVRLRGPIPPRQNRIPYWRLPRRCYSSEHRSQLPLSYIRLRSMRHQFRCTSWKP